MSTMTSERRDDLAAGMELVAKQGDGYLGGIARAVVEILATLPVTDEREELRIKPAKPVVLEDDRGIYGDPAPVEGDEAWHDAANEFLDQALNGKDPVAAVKAIVAKAPDADRIDDLETQMFALRKAANEAGYVTISEAVEAVEEMAMALAQAGIPLEALLICRAHGSVDLSELSWSEIENGVAHIRAVLARYQQQEG